MIKRITACLFALIMSFSLLTGCGSDPVAKELEKYLNTDMAKVNENYQELQDELRNWEDYTTDAQMYDSITNIILPNIEEQFAKLNEIKLSTKEVQAIKAKYETMLTKYKDGYEQLMTALEESDAEALEAALTVLQEGIAALNDYNTALEALAEETDMIVQYAE